MKFGSAKLPKTFTTIPHKNFKRKKNSSNKELSLIENRKVNTNLCCDGRKNFVTRKIQCRRYVGPESRPHFGSLKILILEHHVTTRKPTMMQKGIITFNPTYLTEVTNISSTLKLLNTESLVVQVSNTRFNIQCLHL